MTTIQNPQRTFELAAQGLANLGKKAPQLTTATFGALQLRDREGNILSTLDYRTPLNRAWNQALQALSEQGIDITPDWAKKPFLAQIKTSSDDTQNLGIYITPEKLVVKAWMVDLGSLDWWKDIDTFISYQIKGNRVYQGEGVSNIIALGYNTARAGWREYPARNDKDIYQDAAHAGCVGVRNDAIGSIGDFKTAMNGVMLLYELRTPIEIPFDSPLNFDFPRVSDTDILSVLDIDGEEMFRIQSGPVDEAYCTQYNLSSDLATKGALWTDLFPNPEWVKSHNTLPGLLILDNLRGIGRRFDVKYLLSLEQRLQALEDKLK